MLDILAIQVVIVKSMNSTVFGMFYSNSEVSNQKPAPAGKDSDPRKSQKQLKSSSKRATDQKCGKYYRKQCEIVKSWYS